MTKKHDSKIWWQNRKIFLLRYGMSQADSAFVRLTANVLGSMESSELSSDKDPSTQSRLMIMSGSYPRIL